MEEEEIIVRLLFIFFAIPPLHNPWRKQLFHGENGEDHFLNEEEEAAEKEEWEI